MCVNNRWNGIIIDMAMTDLENFDGSDTYSDVRQEDGRVQRSAHLPPQPCGQAWDQK